MFRRLLSVFKNKKLARQLRKPAGKAGHEVALMMNRANRSLYQLTLEQLQLNPGDTILEIGFGNGALFPMMAAAFPGVNFCGIDYSEDMVREATELNKAMLSAGQLQVTSGQSNQLPYDAGRFAAVYCINVFYFWDNPFKHIREVHRVLKPGGLFAVTIRSRENMDQMPFTRYGFNKWDTGALEKLLVANGFRLERTAKLEESVQLDSGTAVQLTSYCILVKKSETGL